MITRDNYEIYFIDYFDGNLSPSESELLFSFLENNPDIKEEFNEYENIQISCLNISDKSFKLEHKYVVINESNQMDYFIADLENDLNLIEKEKLAQYLSDSKEAKLLNQQVSKLKLTPYKEEVFSSKKTLYKRSGKIFVYRIIPYGIAATFLLLFFTLIRDTSMLKFENHYFAFDDVKGTSIVDDIDTKKIDSVSSNLVLNIDEKQKTNQESEKKVIKNKKSEFVSSEKTNTQKKEVQNNSITVNTVKLQPKDISYTLTTPKIKDGNKIDVVQASQNMGENKTPITKTSSYTLKEYLIAESKKTNLYASIQKAKDNITVDVSNSKVEANPTKTIPESKSREKVVLKIGKLKFVKKK